MKSEDEYFYVHYDRHGLPDAVADSKEELHELTGIKKDSIKSLINWYDNDNVSVLNEINILHKYNIENLTADVAPVIHAHWIKGKYLLKCSNCMFDYTSCRYNYCPYCGAKMDEEEK